ncbi:MAG: caspase family protein [Bacteroidaceae bacterium]|nr:caspase family protein [Bacteroidaceae bacterium]
MNKLVFATLIMLLYANLGFSQPAEYINKTESPRNRVLIQTIGIRYKENDLHSASSLSQYRKSLAEKYIFPGYPDSSIVFSLHGDTLSASIIDSHLKNLEYETSSTDVVIIHIIGHGEYDEANDMYYLICSDGSKLSGDDLCKYITTISGKGALVVVFLDTCHSGALFKKGENGSHFGNNGGVALFAASQRKQDATDLGQSKFTNTIFEVLKTNKSLTLGTLAKKIGEKYHNDSIEKEIDISTGQNPYAFFFPKNRFLDGYKIKDYPIIRAAVSKKTIGKDTLQSTNSRFYVGITVGSNHTCTPYANVNLGVDINNSHKIEAGFTHSLLKKSDEVYMYDNNGIIQNALQYKAMSFYARYGFNWLSLCKDKRRSEFITLAGLSGNIVKGDNLSGFNSSIGKTAGSLMGDVCCRWALDLSKDNKRNVLLHMTAGFDFPIKRDGNVCNVLNSEKYIKNWCSFRPYIEAGVIISPKFLNF